MERRYGQAAAVLYHDTGDPAVREEHEDVIMRIHDDGLLYPVTVVDGEPVYDGAVSHAVILRAVQLRLEQSGAR